MSNQAGTPVSTPAVSIGRATPILHVASLDTSLAYYVDVLGFALQWRAGGSASVRRDEASVRSLMRVNRPGGPAAGRDGGRLS